MPTVRSSQFYPTQNDSVSPSSPNKTETLSVFSSETEGDSMEESAKESSFGFTQRREEEIDKYDKGKKNLQLKVRTLNPTNTISFVQILGTGMDTQDTSPSVLLFFDKQTFIFNAGKGLQRFCTEHKIKLSKFILRPHAHLGLDRTNIPSLVGPSEIMDELLSEIPEIVDAAQHISQFWHRLRRIKEGICPMLDNQVVIEEPWLDENSLPSCLENVMRDAWKLFF